MPNDDTDEGDDGGSDEIARAENVKHLEMIQAVVTRLAGNSFLIKAWSISVAAAAYGIAVNRVDWRICLIVVSLGLTGRVFDAGDKAGLIFARVEEISHAAT